MTISGVWSLIFFCLFHYSFVKRMKINTTSSCMLFWLNHYTFIQQRFCFNRTADMPHHHYGISFPRDWFHTRHFMRVLFLMHSRSLMTDGEIREHSKLGNSSHCKDFSIWVTVGKTSRNIYLQVSSCSHVHSRSYKRWFPHCSLFRLSLFRLIKHSSLLKIAARPLRSHWRLIPYMWNLLPENFITHVIFFCFSFVLVWKKKGIWGYVKFSGKFLAPFFFF